MGEKINHLERRPDPEALLALANHDSRGKLKVFVGAAPGVGKTYAILQNVHRLRGDGVDVVLGYIETHGRKETQALVDNIEIIPRLIINYQDRKLEEFDLDAALKRKPELLVVDELAHTNAPGSRHPKRWQDVEELLNAGINVWTALNIQHLESLADIVSRITGVVVRETVPDIILKTASDVVLVDITPAELIERLNAGKVYTEETASRATQNFFTIGNLTALRELSLRRTAHRVEEQMVDYLRQRAIDGPWETADRLLVCLGPDKASEYLVRRAGRMASALNASWIAVHFERPIENGDNADDTSRVTDLLQLAESLGAEIIRTISTDYTNDILALARKENVTQIILCRSRPKPWYQFANRSLSTELLKKSKEIGILVLSPDYEEYSYEKNFLLSGVSGLTKEILLSLISVCTAIGVGEILSYFIRLPNLSMVFLTSVLFCAVSLGTRAAIISSLFSFLAYNFFFIEPIYTFTIAEPHELFALLIFLIVSILTGSLTGRIRTHSFRILRYSQTTQLLYEFSRKLAAASNIDEVVWASVSQSNDMLKGTSIILLPREQDLDVMAVWPPDELQNAAEISAARWAFEKNEPAGWRTGTLPTIRYRFIPMKTPRRVVGVFGFQPSDTKHSLDPEFERNLISIIEQTATAIDRASLVDEAVKLASLQENEKTRDAILSSLSHDLRTPLTTIKGAVSVLRDMGSPVPLDQKNELLASVAEEADRLLRFVTNLLDMSHIEAGVVHVKRDWVDLNDLVERTVTRVQKIYTSDQVNLILPEPVTLIHADPYLLEQVLFNILDNAHKYGNKSPVELRVEQSETEAIIRITDHGQGIHSDHIGKIFEKFYRIGGADGRKPGTGLGLSICKGFVEAMSGTITAESPVDKRQGTRITVRLPLALHLHEGSKLV